MKKKDFGLFLEEQLLGAVVGDGSAEEVGFVLSVSDGIATILGLEKAEIGEMIKFSNSKLNGLVFNLEENSIIVVIMGDDSLVRQGEEVTRCKTQVDVPVGLGLAGRVVDALGNPLDGLGEVRYEERKHTELKAPGVICRKSVHEPLQTGIKIIDALIPIGRGQRELIIGDRKTGKTSIAIQTIINQANCNKSIKNEKDKVFSIYVAIGQKKSTVARIVKRLEEAGAMEYTTVVCAAASDPAAMQFLAPYSGCAIGEFFRDSGRHALIVYDDLTKHAIAYRQLSLLLRRPPGREAYPGDVFYLHSRLLERAAKLSDEKGSGSLTALPIIETQANDVSAYIPTNVISITDGQIFLDSELFYKGFRPAIDIGLSVSRVGSMAQAKVIKKLSGKIKLELAQFRELETFSQFGSELDQATQDMLDKGRKVSQLFKQDDIEVVSLGMQAIMLFILNKGYLKNIKLENIRNLESEIKLLFEKSHNDIVNEVSLTGEISDSQEKKINDLVLSVLNKYNTVN